MKVTGYELFDVPPRWTLLKVTTDDGVVGWGDTTLSHRRNAVRGAIKDLMEQYVLDSSPLEVEDRWQSMYRGGFYRGGPVLMTAIAGIDQALWDIKGKHTQLPIYDMLGGKVRDRVRLYQHVRGDGVSELQDDAKAQIDRGFTALKTTPMDGLRRIDSPATVETIRQRVAGLREAAGDDVDVLLDFHGRVSTAMAKRLVEVLEEFEPMFYEEPVLVEHEDNYPSIAARTSVPIATGERVFTRWGFKRLLEDQGVDVVQPDLAHAGGITECKKIADMAGTHDVALAPHCPLSPIALAACLQVNACAHNAIIQEQTVHRPDVTGRDTLAILDNDDVLAFDDEGYVDVPPGPGLGIEIDEPRLRELAVEDHEWRPPLWRGADGSVMER